MVGIASAASVVSNHSDSAAPSQMQADVNNGYVRSIGTININYSTVPGVGILHPSLFIASSTTTHSAATQDTYRAKARR